MQAADKLVKILNTGFLIIIIVSIAFGAYYFMPKTGTILAADCGEGRVTLRWYYDADFGNIETGPIASMQMFYTKDGKDRALSQGLDPLSMRFGDSYSPLPFNTDIPTYSIHAIGILSETLARSRPVAIFVDPLNFSMQEFEQLAQCYSTNDVQISAALKKGAENIRDIKDGRDIQIVGLAYISKPELRDRIHLANPDGKFIYSFRGSKGSPNCLSIDDDGAIRDCEGAGGDIFRSSSYAYMLTGDGTEYGGSYYDYSFNSKGETVPQYLKKIRETLRITPERVP